MSVIKAKDLKLSEKSILFDMRWDMKNPQFGISEYQKSHIKGAIFFDAEKYLFDIVKEHGGRHPLPDLNDFKSDMEKLGISDDSEIVVYDTGNLNAPARFWFMLKLIGLEVTIVERGFAGLIEVGYETETTENSPKTIGNITANFNLDIMVDRNYVISSFENEKSVLVDSRSPERYRGENEPIDKIAGRIPTAVNYFFKDNYVDEVMKSDAELKERFKDLFGYEELLVYCGSGITGANNMLAMTKIGLKPKLYLGSYSDYISYQDSEIVKS